MTQPLPIGTLIDGKYRVEQVLGEGGVGVVVAALHVGLEQRVAVKLLRPHMAEGEAATRFLREARATVRLRGEHVARVTDVGTHEGAPYMVMELLEGKDLSDLLEERGPLPEREAADLMLQAIEGIAEAHASGMIHRDIKPANLFVTRRPDGTALVKVLDFGITKVAGMEDGAQTSTQAVMGSPYYMAPEQMRATKDVDVRADVWSLGATIFQCVTGRLPFEDDNFARLTLMVHQTEAPRARSLMPSLSPAMDALIARCLAREPAERFPSVAALAEALAPLASAEAQRHGAAALRLSLHPTGSASGAAGASASPPATALSAPPPAAASSPPADADDLVAPVGRSPKPIFVAVGLAAAGIVVVGGAMLVSRRPAAEAAPTSVSPPGAVSSSGAAAAGEVAVVPPTSTASVGEARPEITPALDAPPPPSATASAAGPAGKLPPRPATGSPAKKAPDDPFGESRK